MVFTNPSDWTPLYEPYGHNGSKKNTEGANGGACKQGFEITGCGPSQSGESTLHGVNFA